MLNTIIVLGWIGILLYFILILTYKKLMQLNEYAFIHLLMAFMHVMWLPLPLALNNLLRVDLLVIGTVFGTCYLVMLIFSLILQTGHITFIVKHNDNQIISDEQGQYMMATLSNPLEAFAGILKSLWAFFLAIAFWHHGQPLMSSLMALFSLFIFYFLFIILEHTLVNGVVLLSKIKPNPLIFNLGSLLFYIILMSYLTFL